jgi:hypothetical protein
MDCQLEYHRGVKRWILASVAVFGLLLASAFVPCALTTNAEAQINGAPASVTSPGFGGRAVNGTPPSVTSLGRQGYAPNGGALRTTVPTNRRTAEQRRNVHRGPRYGGIYAVGVPVPYGENAATDSEEDDADYQGGPTIFDRRGSGAQSYIPPVASIAESHASEPMASDPPEADTAQEITALVFKDGHQLEVGNYAIVGRTLYDMSPGHPRKVALSELDLDATQKQNEQRGVIFQVPPSAQVN